MRGKGSLKTPADKRRKCCTQSKGVILNAGAVMQSAICNQAILPHSTGMLTLELFESGYRLTEYIAHLAVNKENFRANFIRAADCIAHEDLAFFRSLPRWVYIAVLTRDASLDALRDVPIISRLSAEVTRLSLRLFVDEMHRDAAAALRQIAQDACASDQPNLPVIAFFDENMTCIGVQCGPLPALAEEMQRRRRVWVADHPEIKDALLPLDDMSAITRTKITQAMYAMTTEQRAEWGRRLVERWRQILATNNPS